jgi:hypothetical protein
MRFQFTHTGLEIILETQSCLTNREKEVTIRSILVLKGRQLGRTNYIEPVRVDLVEIISIVFDLSASCAIAELTHARRTMESANNLILGIMFCFGL